MTPVSYIVFHDRKNRKYKAVKVLYLSNIFKVNVLDFLLLIAILH